MGEQDWLEQGHGSGSGLQPMIKGSTRRTPERVSIRSVLRGRDSAPRTSRRRTKALVGWLLYCFTAVGGSAAAWTVRETLFPSLGAPTTRSVWENPKVDTPVTTEPASTSTESSVVLALAADTVATTQASVEPQTVPSASPPTNSDDNSGSGKAPTTGTTIADDSSNGPGPGTTVDDHSTDTSTPHTSSPTSVDTSTTPSSPDPSTSVSSGDSSGKGKGGGGIDDPPSP